MTRIGHLFDRSAGWEQRVAVSQLIEGLPRDRYSHGVVSIDPAAGSSIRLLKEPVESLPRFVGLDILTAPAVARFHRRHRIDLIHAWSIRPAVAARAAAGARAGAPLVVQLSDPQLALREAVRLRTLARPRHFAVICSCDVVRRRLAGGGLPPELVVVIRPGVDFALINRCRRGSLRREIGLSSRHHAVTFPEPVTRAGGQFEAFAAVAPCDYLSDWLRIVVSGESPETRRIIRFASALPVARVLVAPGAAYPFEQLLAVSDTLLVTPRSDISTTSLAWAMAAGVTVAASAVPSVAELITHKVNGLLFRHVPGKSMTAAISRLLAECRSQQSVAEVARGQAYRIFSLRRYVKQMMRLYRNVMEGASPGDGIIDPGPDVLCPARNL